MKLKDMIIKKQEILDHFDKLNSHN